MKRYLGYKFASSCSGWLFTLFEVDDDARTINVYAIPKKLFGLIYDFYKGTVSYVKSADRKQYFIDTLHNYSASAKFDLDYGDYIGRVERGAKVLSLMNERANRKSINRDWMSFDKKTIEIIHRFFFNDASSFLFGCSMPYEVVNKIEMAGKKAYKENTLCDFDF